jgi:hypothetical protein
MIVRESINFEREGEPFDKLRIGVNRFKARPYPQMSVEEFVQWYKRLTETASSNLEDTKEFLLTNLMNNEVESDDQLAGYLIANGIDKEIVDQVIPMRSYFNDFRYGQHIG